MFSNLKSTAVAAVVLAVGALIGGAGAVAFAAAHRPTPAAPEVAAAAVSSGPVESGYVQVPTCVLVDTRAAGGVFANGESRNYRARGTDPFYLQGGSLTGCRIPDNASVLSINISAVSPVNSGFIKLTYYADVATGTTSVNYAKNQSITGFTNLQLAAPNLPAAFKVTNYGGPTHIVVSVLGYYIGPLAADVAFDGTLLHGSRVVSAARVSTGRYEVTFDRNITGCFPSVASYNGLLTAIQFIAGQPSKVLVYNLSQTNQFVDSRVYVTIAC